MEEEVGRRKVVGQHKDPGEGLQLEKLRQPQTPVTLQWGDSQVLMTSFSLF